MKYPNFEGKHAHESMIEPSQYIDYMKSRGRYPSRPAPKGVILCYQRSLLAYIREHHPTTPCDGFLSDLLFLSETHDQVAVMGGFGIGSPVASAILEELIAFGVREFVSIGTSGTLQKNIQIGDLVVCDKAIRDEGTSHHYLPPEKFAYPSKTLTNRLQNALTAIDKTFHVGASWTIDAPYRETVAEARHYQNEGVMVVEMEAAALFSVAQYRSAEIAAIFTVSDSLADLKWHPEFHSAKTKDGLEAIYRAAVAAF